MRIFGGLTQESDQGNPTPPRFLQFWLSSRGFGTNHPLMMRFRPCGCRGGIVNRSEILIVPGLSVSKTGQATVDSSIADLLFELAIKLEKMTGLPVDVQHVVAALVLAARSGQLDPQQPLSRDDSELAAALKVQLK
ncbi:MAG: hypothetical protein DWI02_02740, partial [Planctomycetota bacterium]